MEQDSGFFARWSRRKVETRQLSVSESDVALQVPAIAVHVDAKTPATSTLPDTSSKTHSEPAHDPAVTSAPTMDDVVALTPDSDFARFVAPQVSGEVRNAALKKLFSDPHFNVMDGLDTYIDDYSLPDPLPIAMLKKMTQAVYLGLVESEEKQPLAEVPSAPRISPARVNDNVSVTSTPAACTDVAAMKAHDEDDDLRLQSHYDPGSPNAGTGTDQDPGS